MGHRYIWVTFRVFFTIYMHCPLFTTISSALFTSYSTVPLGTVKAEHRKISLCWFLGYFSPKNWTVFNCYLLHKHSPIRLHEKTVKFWGEFVRNSPKIKRGNFENSFVFP